VKSTKGGLKRSKETLMRAAAEEPGNSVTQSELGIYYRALGETEKSLLYFRRAVEAELPKPVPNEIKIRASRTAIDGLSSPPESE
jgi:hypothetical protein